MSNTGPSDELKIGIFKTDVLLLLRNHISFKALINSSLPNSSLVSLSLATSLSVAVSIS